MFEIWFLERDDWGNLKYRKRLGFKKKLSTAIKIASKYGKHSYVKRYMETKPVWINGVTE